jgi:hypothetical protein
LRGNRLIWEAEALLERLEAALQSALERVGRWLPGKLHPLELAAQLRAAMDHSQVISTESGYVANTYRILLNPGDMQALVELSADVEAELARHLRQYAGQRDYLCGPRISVTLSGDPGTSPGAANVNADFDRAVVPALLHITEGLPGQVFHVNDTTNLGRAADCDIRLPDPTISRHHAQLEWTYRGWLIRDLGSSNGTEVNGQPISECLLSDNDLVQLGSVQLRFSFHGE